MSSSFAKCLHRAVRVCAWGSSYWRSGRLLGVSADYVLNAKAAQWVGAQKTTPWNNFVRLASNSPWQHDGWGAIISASRPRFGLRCLATRAIEHLEEEETGTGSARIPPRQLVAYCVSLEEESFYFTGLRRTLSLQYGVEPISFFDSEVHHFAVPAFDRSANQAFEIFLFKDGTVVLWDVPTEEEGRILHLLNSFRIPRDGNAYSAERESLQWHYDASVTECTYDRGTGTLVLPADFDALTDAAMRKAALSCGMRGSVRLDRMERRMDSVLAAVRAVPKSIIRTALADARPTAAARARVLSTLGQIVRLRELTNLRGEFEPPEEFWNRPGLEGAFRVVYRALEVPPRIAAINQKLDYAYQLCEARREQLAEAHMTRLVVWIITLIIIIIALEPFKMARIRRIRGAAAAATTLPAAAAAYVP